MTGTEHPRTRHTHRNLRSHRRDPKASAVFETACFPRDKVEYSLLNVDIGVGAGGGTGPTLFGLGIIPPLSLMR